MNLPSFFGLPTSSWILFAKATHSCFCPSPRPHLISLFAPCKVGLEVVHCSTVLTHEFWLIFDLGFASTVPCPILRTTCPGAGSFFNCNFPFRAVFLQLLLVRPASQGESALRFKNLEQIPCFTLLNTPFSSGERQGKTRFRGKPAAK